MDSSEQAAGEKRVRVALIDPLLNLGLGKPSTVTAKQFDDMVSNLCQRLAYMSDLNLSALAEVVAANPGGKDQDRFPIANKILAWAGNIQSPSDSASPLIRAVFSHDLGRSAIRDGWGPELLVWLRRNRSWPRNYDITQIRDLAAQNAHRIASMDDRVARGRDVAKADLDWAAARQATLDKCVEISNSVCAGEQA